MDADSKLIMAYYVGDRSSQAADAFVTDLAPRVRNDIQITTDGYRRIQPQSSSRSKNAGSTSPR